MKNQDVTLEKGCVKKLFWKFAIPSILGMLIVSMQMMVDGLFLSWGVGPMGLAAVNLSMPLINSLLSVALMITMGGVVLAGIAYGDQNTKRGESMATLTFVLQNGVLLLLTALFFIFRDHIIMALGANEEVFPYVESYLSIMIAGSVLYNMPIFTEAFMRVVGKPNWVFVSAAFCFGCNVLMDYLFIMVLDMGMAGAAYGTCAANAIASVVLLTQIRFGKLEWNWKDVKNIFYNGSSELLTTISSAVATYVFNLVLMKHVGILGVSALTIVFYVNSIVNISLYGLSQALQPIVSFNLGARNLEKITTVLKTSLRAGIVIGITAFAAMHLLSDTIISLFVKDNMELHALAGRAVSFATFAYLFSFVNIISSSFHTSIEKPMESALIALGRSIVFVMLYLSILPELWGEKGIWMTIPLAEVSCMVISLPLLYYSLKQLRGYVLQTK